MRHAPGLPALAALLALAPALQAGPARAVDGVFNGAVEETSGTVEPLQTAGNLGNGSPCP